MWISVLATAHATAWVLEGKRPRDVNRALRAARAASIVRAVAYDERAVCVEVEDPRLRVRNRVARRLGGPVETRSDCDWGWFPEGRGWVAVVVERPAEGLLPTLEGLGWPYWDLRTQSEGPIRICVSEMVAGPKNELRAVLRDAGLSVRGIREVGGCTRDR